MNNDNMPFCPECGAKNDEEAKFCSECGSSLKGIEKDKGESVSSGNKKTSVGLEENIEGALCYVLAWISGIIFLLIEEKSEFVRFHAAQSIVTFLPLSILWAIFGGIGRAFWFFGPGLIFLVIGWLLGILIFIAWLFLMYKAYSGEMYKLPIAGDIAEDIK